MRRATSPGMASAQSPPPVPPPSRPSRADVLANFVLFQLAWFACILGAARGLAWLGTACVAVAIVWHLASVREPRREALLVLFVMLLGGLFDSALGSRGWITYASGQWQAWLAPHWIIALWGLLAITLNVSLRWLRGRWVLAAVMGAVASPLSYAGGVRLGAAAFVDAPRQLAALAIGWAVLMPLLMLLASRFDGVAGRPTGAGDA